VAPAGIVTEVGTVAAALPEVRVMTAPPAGAAAGMTTELVVVLFPPTMEAEAKFVLTTNDSFTVNDAVALPFPVAVMVVV
jgi:hypothetical protein